MKNYINILPSKRYFFLFIFCCIAIMKGMESETPIADKLKRSPSSVCFPDKKIKIFDDLVAYGIPSNSIIPKGILITPDLKGALLAEPGGRVSYVNFSNLFDSKPHVLIEHPCSKFMPMIAAATMAMGTNKKGLLRVVSLGNYYNEKDHKRVSECIISDNEYSLQGGDNSHNVFNKSYSQMKKFDKPAQAIALNSLGTVLVVGFCDCVQAVDLLTGQYKYKTCKFIPHVPGMVVVDVAVKPDNQNVTAVDERGIIDVKSLSVLRQASYLAKATSDTQDERGEDISFLSFKSGIDTGDAHIIRKITFLDNSDLLYKTKNGTIKKICAADWIENAQGIVKSHIFSQDFIYDKVEIDQNSENATIRWTEDSSHEEDVRLRIKIYRENDTSAERFLLKLGNNLPKSCRYITAEGQDGIWPTHIIVAAMRAERIVVLCSDGYLYIYNLPEKHKMPTEDDVRRINQREVPRSRSFSSPSIDRKKEEREEIKEKRKSSFNISLFKKDQNAHQNKKKTEHHSPSTSPKSKRATISPRSISVTTLNEEDDYRKAMQQEASNVLLGWEKEKEDK